jgi:Domain of unknown function (DUF397)
MSYGTPAGDNGDECDRGDWRKSSYSMSNGHCLEAARFADGSIGVRDSKAADSSVLRFEPEVWSVFLRKLRASSE